MILHPNIAIVKALIFSLLLLLYLPARAQQVDTQLYDSLAAAGSGLPGSRLIAAEHVYKIKEKYRSTRNGRANFANHNSTIVTQYNEYGDTLLERGSYRLYSPFRRHYKNYFLYDSLHRLEKEIRRDTHGKADTIHWGANMQQLVLEKHGDTLMQVHKKGNKVIYDHKIAVKDSLGGKFYHELDRWNVKEQLYSLVLPHDSGQLTYFYQLSASGNSLDTTCIRNEYTFRWGGGTLVGRHCEDKYLTRKLNAYPTDCWAMERHYTPEHRLAYDLLITSWPPMRIEYDSLGRIVRVVDNAMHYHPILRKRYRLVYYEGGSRLPYRIEEYNNFLVSVRKFKYYRRK